MSYTCTSLQFVCHNNLVWHLTATNGGTTLKDDLLYLENYNILPKPVWNLLVCWYGLSEQSKPIMR